MRFLTILLIFLLTFNNALAQQNQKRLPPLTGKINENSYNNKNTKGSPTGIVKDSFSGNPISGADVSIPDKGLSTKTAPDGSFKFDIPKLDNNFIISIKKEGYLPFSLNVKKEDLSAPFVLKVEKQQGQIVIDSQIHHLGDNNYSEDSAGADSFQLPSEGPTFMKDFYVESLPTKGLTLHIGSLIGLDTLMAKQLDQTALSVYSSPLVVYLNSIKIAEIAINGNNKTIPINKQLLKPHSKNLLLLQTGVNQTLLENSGKIDYDDIEFMNLILQETR